MARSWLIGVVIDAGARAVTVRAMISTDLVTTPCGGGAVHAQSASDGGTASGSAAHDSSRGDGMIAIVLMIRIFG